MRFATNAIMKKIQISIIGYIMLVFNIFCRNYVCIGDESSVLIVLVRDIVLRHSRDVLPDVGWDEPKVTMLSVVPVF